MSCQVRLYDSEFESISRGGILLIAIDQGPPPVNCCDVQPNVVQVSFDMESYSGAHLVFREGKFVYQVAIYDPIEMFAGTTLHDLNGNRPGFLDVVLYKAPDPRLLHTLQPPTSSSDVIPFIDSQTNWTIENKTAVKSAVRAYVNLRELFTPGMDDNKMFKLGRSDITAFFPFIFGYARFLSVRGISPDIFGYQRNILRHVLKINAHEVNAADWLAKTPRNLYDELAQWQAYEDMVKHSTLKTTPAVTHNIYRSGKFRTEKK